MVTEKMKDLVAFALFYQNYLNDFEEQHSKELVENVKKYFAAVREARNLDHVDNCNKGEPCLRCVSDGLYLAAEHIVQKFK